MTIRKAVLAAAGVVLVGSIAACSSPPSSVAFTLGTTDRNVTYCSSEQLDLYIPRDAVTRPLPLALYIHGGGMTAGDKSDINPVFLDTLASAGYAVASVNYRLAPGSEFPAQIEDVKCAIRYLRLNAPRFGVNGNELFALGTSVGGELAALAALTGPHSAFDQGPNATEPSNVTAAADLFGPANLTEGSSGFSSEDIQQVFGRNAREVLLASPTHLVVAGAPPILLVQGVEDTTVRRSQAIELYGDLEAAGDPAQLLLVQNMGHMFVQVGSKPLDPSLQVIARDVVRFFDRAGG